MKRDQHPHLGTLLLALLLAGGAVACDSDIDGPNGTGGDGDEERDADATYDVLLEWQIEGDYECVGLLKGETAAFDKITIDLYKHNAAGERSDVQYIDNIECSLFEYTIPRIESGEYLYTINAWATYEQEQLPFYQASGSFVIADEEIDPQLASLTRGKGSLEIQWGFENSMQCSTNLTEQVVISIIDEERQKELDPITRPCESGSHLVPDLRWSTYTVLIEGFADEAESADWAGVHDETPVELRPGQRLPVMVIMNPTQM